MIAPDGSPYRDLYHSGEFTATHIDSLTSQRHGGKKIGWMTFPLESTHLDRLTNPHAKDNPDLGRQQAGLLRMASP
jgi:hypothetical protein